MRKPHSRRRLPCRPRKSGSRTALALSRGFRMAADRFDIRGDVFVTPEWRRLIPTSWQIVPDAWHAMLSYLSFTSWKTEGYNALQQLELRGNRYSCCPLSIATGVAMSPAVAARFPWYIKSFMDGKAHGVCISRLFALHRILHRTRHDRGSAWFPERAGADCTGTDARSAVDACSCGLAVGLAGIVVIHT